MSLDTEERRHRVERAKLFFADFRRCPTTGRILEQLAGDDKVLCRCGTSNPEVPTERTELTGVHIARFLKPATPEEYVDQMEALRDGAGK